jgi:hypothetical protein
MSLIQWSVLVYVWQLGYLAWAKYNLVNTTASENDLFVQFYIRSMLLLWVTADAKIGSYHWMNIYLSVYQTILWREAQGKEDTFNFYLYGFIFIMFTNANY